MSIILIIPNWLAFLTIKPVIHACLYWCHKKCEKHCVEALRASFLTLMQPNFIFNLKTATFKPAGDKHHTSELCVSL